MKLTIEKVIVGGQGLATIPSEVEKLGGMRAFVPFTLPGEIVEADIREQHRGYCLAEARSIEGASKFRTPPSCPWFGTCGGCQLQHSDYGYQVEMKREMLIEGLTRAGVRDLPPISILVGEALGYRNRVRLQAQTLPKFEVGYRQAKSHRMTAIDHCPIAVPLLERCISTVRVFGQHGNIPSGLQELELFTNHDQSELLITFRLPPQGKFEEKHWARFLEDFQREIPQFTGSTIYTAEKVKSYTARPVMEWGQKSLRYRVAGLEYTVSHGSFFQINATLLDAFVAAVTENERGQCAWDLYSGVGLFTLALSERFESVFAVESSPFACKDFRANLHGWRATLASSTTLDYLKRTSALKGAVPDLVLLDPPRAGLGVEGCGLLARCHPRKIVYVSCDPATLGRDLAALIQSGYRLQRLQLVDMFPQTHHLETIAVLQR